MSMGLAGKWEQRLSLKWVWPLNLAKYDQAPTLRKDERTTIENMFGGHEEENLLVSLGGHS